MILKIILTALLASIIVLCVESTELSYDNETRTVNVNCGYLESYLEIFGELIDNGDFNGDGSDWENALEVYFSGACDIPYVPKTFFKKLPLIETVDLGSNQVALIERQDFQENKKLKIMKFGHNSITKLPENLFSFTPHIEEVYFEKNEINKIDPNTFAEGVENLKLIDLQTNLIKTLPENLFAKVTMLETLSLQNNKIVRLNCNILPPSFAGTMTIDVQGDLLSQIVCLKSSLPFKNETEQKSSGNDLMKNNSTTNDESSKNFTMMANNNSSTLSNKIIQNHGNENSEVLHTIKYLLIFLCVVCLAFIVTKVVLHLKSKNAMKF